MNKSQPLQKINCPTPTLLYIRTNMITTAAPAATITTTTNNNNNNNNNNNLGVQGVCVLFYDTTPAIMIIQLGISHLRGNTMRRWICRNMGKNK